MGMWYKLLSGIKNDFILKFSLLDFVEFELLMPWIRGLEMLL